MSAKDSAGIDIPSVFVGELDGRLLLANYQFPHDYLIVLNGDLPFDINVHLLLPFSVVVGLCFVIMMGFMIMKCVRDQRRLQRHRLPRSALKEIPIVRFNKSTMAYEMCIICLDDYTDGDKLRVLPCDHGTALCTIPFASSFRRTHRRNNSRLSLRSRTAYHCKCIDIWLTKNRRVCPICKRKVLLKRHQSRRSQSAAAAGDADRSASQSRRAPPHHHRSSDDSASDSDADDSTPLLNPVQHSAANISSTSTSNHGTFTSSGPAQRVNPFDRTPNLPPNLRSDAVSPGTSPDGIGRLQRIWR